MEGDTQCPPPLTRPFYPPARSGGDVAPLWLALCALIHHGPAVISHNNALQLLLKGAEGRRGPHTVACGQVVACSARGGELRHTYVRAFALLGEEVFVCGGEGGKPDMPCHIRPASHLQSPYYRGGAKRGSSALRAGLQHLPIAYSSMHAPTSHMASHGSLPVDGSHSYITPDGPSSNRLN